MPLALASSSLHPQVGPENNKAQLQLWMALPSWHSEARVPQGIPAQQLGRLQGQHLRQHPESQPLVVSPWAAGLVGRGLADPARFPLTRPLPPPLPGLASRNEVFFWGWWGWGGGSLAHLPHVGS